MCKKQCENKCGKKACIKIETDVTCIPQEGQFAAIWMFNGEFWGGTFKWIDGELWEFNSTTDDWDGYWSEDDLSSMQKLQCFQLK